MSVSSFLLQGFGIYSYCEKNHSTPAFLHGYIGPDGKVKAMKKISGAQPYAAFKDAIEGLLSSAKQ